MQREPEDQRDGSQRSDESTRRNTVGIDEGAFVGTCIGRLLVVGLVGNVYLGSGGDRCASQGVIGTRADG